MLFAQDPAAASGKRIYEEGVGIGGREITAVLGEGGAELPASTLPCAGCHGDDGRGNPEGGVSPSDLTWEALTRPYEVGHPSGRRHPPYDDYLLRRAVTMGIDPGGNKLHVAMPRYQLTHEEAAALVGYLEKLGRDRDPGITGERLRVGVVLAPPGQLQALGEAVRAVLDAYAESVNEGGGVFGRRLELAYVAPPRDAAERRAAIERFLEEENVFALTAVFMAGAEEEIAGLAAEREVPMVGPFTIEPEVGFPLNRFVFYTLPGLGAQARALVDFVADRQTAGAITVVHGRSAPFEGIVDAVLEQASQQGDGSPWSKVRIRGYARGEFDAMGLAAAEKEAGTDTLFCICSDVDTAALLAAAQQLEWKPQILLLSSLAGAGAAKIEGLEEQIFTAFPTHSSDRRPEALDRYRELARRHRLPSSFVSMQLAALTSAELLAEGLRRAGRDLSREKLVEALESLHHFETGLTPPLTYGPNRRIGALGAYVLPTEFGDREVTATESWVTPR